jgi:hypothetical protein
VWWSASLQARVQHNDYQIQMMKPDIEEAISFTKMWPSGKWGSGELPSDTRQDLKIEWLERQVSELNKRIFHMNGHGND